MKTRVSLNILLMIVDSHCKELLQKYHVAFNSTKQLTMQSKDAVTADINLEESAHHQWRWILSLVPSYLVLRKTE